MQKLFNIFNKVVYFLYKIIELKFNIPNYLKK